MPLRPATPDILVLGVLEVAVIHYHGLPITPDVAAVEVIGAGHAFVSFAHPQQLGLAIEFAQSFALDNGAFPAWRNGAPIKDWTPYYEWAANCKLVPNCDFAVIPDVIDGGEADNDALVGEWPLSMSFGAPVWHMHESFERLERLVAEWNRVCIGSSGEFAKVGNYAWWMRMYSAMCVCCDSDGRPKTKIHGLRMLNPSVFELLPLSSADSTNIGRNVGIDKRWTGSYPPAGKTARAAVMRGRIESRNSPATFDFTRSYP